MTKAENSKETVAEDFEAVSEASGSHEFEFSGATSEQIHEQPKKEKTRNKTVPKMPFMGGK